jgi:hypothetical protein
MDLLDWLRGKKNTASAETAPAGAAQRCSNCAARVLVTSNTVCGLCASDPRLATRRRLAAASQRAKGILDPKCGKCGISETERFQEFQQAAAAKAIGTFKITIIGRDKPLVLYCEHCDKYFCGNCQTDLGFDSGCPECKANIQTLE